MSEQRIIPHWEYGKVYLLGVQYNSLIGKIITFFTNGIVSILKRKKVRNHCAVMINGIVYEIMFDGRVVTNFEEYYMASNKTVDLIETIPPIDHLRALEFLEHTKSRKYDFLRTIGYPIRRLFSLNIKSSDNCVEMVDNLFFDQGYNLFNRRNVSPEDLCRQFENLKNDSEEERNEYYKSLKM